MPRKRDIAIVFVIIGAIVVLVLPSYGDYSARSKVTAVLNYIGVVKSELESACGTGSFAKYDNLAQLGVSEAAPTAFVAHGQLSRTSPDTVRFRTAVTDIYGHTFFGLFPWKVVPKGSTIEFQYSCTEAGTFSSQFLGSTIDAKYLPASLRGS